MSKFIHVPQSYSKPKVGRFLRHSVDATVYIAPVLCDNFWATVSKTVRPMLSDRCLSVLTCPVLSVCNVGVLWPHGWMDQAETWHAGSPRPGHIVLDVDPATPPPKGHCRTAHQFSAHICCGQMAG